MKQIKISSFFTKDEGQKRKRDDSPVPSTSSQKAKISKTNDPGSKKRKTTNTKGKTNKENGFRTLQTIFAVNSQPQKPVLSPKKLTENVIVRSPEKNIAKDLELEFSDLAFDEPMSDLEKPVPEETWHLTKSDLNLSRLIRCDVLRFMFSNHPKCEQVILLRAEGSEKKAVCKLRDMWTFLNLAVNDKVSVKADEVDGEWVVHGKNGYVILHPDMKISITSLVNGMYCVRRGVLSYHYKIIKSNVNFMVMGRVIHDLLQEALRRKSDSEKDIKDILHGLLQTQEYLRDFYLNDMKLEDASLEASAYIPKIMDFIRTYLKGDVQPTGKNFAGRITEVMDIEELVTSSHFGIQGRVDVTVKVQTKDRKRVMPLELKTGRASFSREHQIQIIMYTLLLDELIRNVDSGLLLYLKEGIMEEVKPEFGEIRNLLLLRNEFVKYLKEEGVPEPIRSSSCSQCGYSRVCYTYLKPNMDSISANHPIMDLKFPDLKDSHVSYFMSWAKMIFSECKSEEMEIDELTLGNVVESGETYRHIFRLNRKTTNIHTGCHVNVVTRNKFFRGRLIDMTDTTCTVELDEKLNYHETYKLATAKSNLLSLYLTNLSSFMGEEYGRLRELIIDRVSPVCVTKITKSILNEESISIIRGLNREQQKAILKTFAAKEFLLIKGPPGTGKTETIVALVKFLRQQKQTVLITSHTHSSIDNILLKLDGVEYLRFGAPTSIDKRIHDKCFAKLFPECKTMEDVKKLYSCPVMASTCLGLDLDMIGKVKFDVCLMDESSQVMQAEAIRPLLFCKKFVLIGDSNQLPPVVKSAEARKSGMSVSIFERLERDDSTVSLRQQYRMNRVLNDLANDFTYAGELECGNETIAEATLHFGKRQLSNAKSWIREVLSPDLSKSVFFIDTCEYFTGLSPSKSSRTSPVEAAIISTLVTELITRGIEGKDIGVISPYCTQVEFLSRRLSTAKDVEVSTVDQYQGRDKEVVFFSFAKHWDGGFAAPDAGHILNDKRRLTVAVTRAKVKLVMIGDLRSISGYESVKKLLSCLSANQVMRLKDGENDFFWNDLDIDKF